MQRQQSVAIIRGTWATSQSERPSSRRSRAPLARRSRPCSSSARRPPRCSRPPADAVRDLLVARGITSQRIRTKGYGAKFPIVDNDTSVGRQQNRRVEVLVLTERSTAEAPQR